MLVNDQNESIRELTEEQSRELTEKLHDLGWIFLHRKLEDAHLRVLSKRMLVFGGSRRLFTFKDLIRALNLAADQYGQAGTLPPPSFIFDTIAKPVG